LKSSNDKDILAEPELILAIVLS